MARPVSLAPRADAARLSRTLPERTLENELQNLKHQIRENERIWNGFRRLELQMIGAHSLREVITNLVQGLPQLFPRVERVTLACLDPDAELTRLMEAEAPGTELSSFIALSPEMLASLFPRPWRPQLGPMDDAIHHLLFPGHPAPLASMALTPLVLREELIGCLNQASREASHFRPDTGTDLARAHGRGDGHVPHYAVSHERLKIDGLTDPLTGLYNRRFFERRLPPRNSTAGRAGATARSPACWWTWTTSSASTTATAIRSATARYKAWRACLGIELRGSDVLARYGGEEFVLLLPDTTLDQAQAIAERLRMQVEHMTPTGPGNPGPAGDGEHRACLPRAQHHARSQTRGVAIATGRRRALPRQAGRA